MGLFYSYYSPSCIFAHTLMDASSNEAGVPTTEAVAVSGSAAAMVESNINSLQSSAPLVSGVPISSIGDTSGAGWLQLLARARAPSNVTAARLRAANVVDSRSAPRSKVKETTRARKLRVGGSDRASRMQSSALSGATGTPQGLRVGVPISV